jgi:DNA-binding IclR family transcriptional regulator
MGIFDRIQSEIEAREEQEGITPADLLELSPALRKLMNRVTRQGKLTVKQAAAHVGESAADTRKMLDSLVAKGFLEREEETEGWVYRTRFARKRPRTLPAGIWSALEQRTREK